MISTIHYTQTITLTRNDTHNTIYTQTVTLTRDDIDNTLHTDNNNDKR